MNISRRDALRGIATVAAAPLAVSCGIDGVTRPGTASRRLRVNSVFAVASTPVPLIVIGDSHYPRVLSPLHPSHRIAEQVKARLAGDANAWALHMGDVVENGTAQEYRDNAAPALDAILDRLCPVPGNHDSKDAANLQAQSYFAYFGARAGEPGVGYYVKTFGDTWVGFFLNSQWARATQAARLAADLPQYADRHIFAVMHQPYMAAACNMGGVRATMNWPGFNGMGQFWAQLEQHGAEFVLSGHAHRWERFPRMIRDTSNLFTGRVDDRGIRQFIVGTGGVTTMNPWTPGHPHIERTVVARGPAEFTLHQNHFEWFQRDHATGAILDSGTQVCRKTIVPPTTEEPPPPEEPPTCS
jgi:predicted phosphodiesterase